MKSTIPIMGFIIAWACLLTPAAAEPIYKWVSKDGVKQFSSEPPPPGVEHFEQLESTSESTSDQNTSQQRRRSYDIMVEKAKYDAQRNQQERLNKERARKAAKRSAEKKRLEVRVTAEQQRLEQLLQKAKSRGLSRTYSQGMRQGKVDKIQKKLDRLKTSPQAYFEKKSRQGADANE